MVYALVAYPTLGDEDKAGSILLRTRRHAADILVCVGEGDSEIANIARIAGARVLVTECLESMSSLRSLLETIQARGPDVLVLCCDGPCDPSVIPALLGPIENDGADVVEAPWSGFRAFSRSAIAHLRANNGGLEITPSAGGLRTVRLSQPPVAFSSDSEAAMSILTIGGVLLLAMGILLAVVVCIRLADGVFYLDHALLSIGVIVVGLIAAIAGRRLSAVEGVADEPHA